MIDLYLALATAAVVVLLCTSSIMEPLRRLVRRFKVLECPFCTSWWVALAAILYEGSGEWFYIALRWPAVVCLANIGVLLIHLSIATMGEYEDD